MRNRMKLLIDFIHEADLELISHCTKDQKYVAEVRAPNGVVGTFGLATRGGDMRGDLNSRGDIRRFARANAIQSETGRNILTLPKREAPKAEPATTIAADTQLSMVEFYRLCEWTKHAVWANYADMGVATVAARVEIDAPVNEESLREAMRATGSSEPDAWNPMPEPHVVVARELAAMMKGLGVEPSRHFARLIEAIGV